MNPTEVAILTVGLLLGYLAGRRFGPHESSEHLPVRSALPPDGAVAAESADPLPSLADPEADDAAPSASRSLVSYIDQLDKGPREGELHFVCSGATEGGKSRHHLVMDDPNWSLVAVTDGLSSHADGSRASELVLTKLEETFRDAPAPGSVSERRPAGANRLVWAVEAANQTVFEEAAYDPKLSGMTATLVAAVFLPNEGQLCIAHVGDSRAYRLREDRWQLLTAAHTLAAKGVSGPFSSKLYRAVGLKAKVRVDLVVASVEAGDVYLFCTDAVVKAFGDEQLAGEMRKGLEPGLLASRLIEEAARLDIVNASAVVTRVTTEAGQRRVRTERTA